jgi:hypothetical protein
MMLHVLENGLPLAHIMHIKPPDPELSTKITKQEKGSTTSPPLLREDQARNIGLF